MRATREAEHRFEEDTDPTITMEELAAVIRSAKIRKACSDRIPNGALQHIGDAIGPTLLKLYRQC